MMGWFGNKSDSEKAREYLEVAEAAKADLNFSGASENFFKAAHHFGLAGESWQEKYYKSFGWFCKAASFEATSAEDDIRKAKFFDLAVRGVNETLGYFPEGKLAFETNMRQFEANKYAMLSNAEGRRADKAQGKAKLKHIYRRSEYCLSVASCHVAAGELALKDDDQAIYHSEMAVAHQSRAIYHFCRAVASEVLEDWQESLNGYQRAKEEGQRAVEEYRKAVSLVQTHLKKAGEHLLSIQEEQLEEYIDKIAEVRPKAERAARAEAPRPEPEGVTPNLDVRVESREGMVENLVSTVTVKLENTGQADARDVKVELHSSFIDGETSATLECLRAGEATRLGFSIIPNKAGSPSATFHISYEDSRGKSYSQKVDTALEVARRKEERPPPATIINVKGDYIDDRDTIVKDSVVSRSNIGPNGDDLAAKLQQLAQMHKDGILSDEQFEAAKNKLLD